MVGTAFVRPESEPSKGRILVLQYTAEDRRLTLVTEREVKGAVYQVGCSACEDNIIEMKMSPRCTLNYLALMQVVAFQSKLLNSCNNKVQLHK